MNMDNSNEIDSIIDQLKNDSVDTPQIKRKPTVLFKDLTDDSVNEYVYNKTSEVIESGLDAINNLKDSIMTGQDPKEISALAQLIGATTKAIDGLNKINLQIKQHKNNLEVAKLENDSIKKLQSNTTNVIAIASREDVMKKLFDKQSNKLERIELIDEGIVDQ
jgi:hypothetical protein